MRINTAELTGAALDWAVASAKGYSKIAQTISGEIKEFLKMHAEGYHNYSTDWAQGGPIIEREKIDVFKVANLEEWCGSIPKLHKIGWRFIQYGHTPLIAAMRCYVFSRLGDDVDIPEELL